MNVNQSANAQKTAPIVSSNVAVRFLSIFFVPVITVVGVSPFTCRFYSFLTDIYPGVRSKVNIRKGQFIDKYIGEIITSEEAEKRRQESTKSQRKDVYLFALDKFSDVNSLDPRLSGPAYEVDGEFYSGPTRFINHSCDPNVRIFARVGDHADKHIHDLAFFAVEDIPAQTELTFDYVDGEDAAIKAETLDPKLRSQMTKCLCRTKKCRGYLW